MITLTTAQVLSLSRKKLLETGAEILSDADLTLYANLAQDDVQRRVFPNAAIKTATVTFVAGTATNTPTDFGTLYADGLDANTNVFPEFGLGDFARLNSRNGITVDAGVLKVSPTTTTSLTVRYYPAVLTLSGAQNPTVNGFLTELLVYGTVYRAFEDLQDLDMAAYYEGKYETKMLQKGKIISNFEENGQRGGTLFNGIPIVGDSNSYDNNF